MGVFTRAELGEIAGKYEGPCVSIFMPTHRAGKQIGQDPIRFKNLLREAEERLTDVGLRSPAIKILLEPAQELLRDSSFWRHQSNCLAVFLAESFFRFYRLPCYSEELVVITNRFHVKPLLPLLRGDGRFYVLALSQNEVRLLEGTRHSVSEVNLEDIPENIAEALRYDDPEKQLQLHSIAFGGKGERAAIFHGHGGVEDAKDNIERFLRQIDKGLCELLKHEKAALVLAGVDYLLHIYREVSAYPHLIDEGVEGNPEGLSPEELHKQAWPIVKPYFEKEPREAAARYRQLAGTGRTSIDLGEIVPAAYHGKVELLFVDVGVQRWGAFDAETNTVHLRQKQDPGSEDLLDFAAVQTLLNGGNVYAVNVEEISDNTPLAAVFRY
jgi:hypothetical protein